MAPSLLLLAVLRSLIISHGDMSLSENPPDSLTFGVHMDMWKCWSVKDSEFGVV